MQREALQVASVRELSEVNQELRVEEDIRSEPTLAGIVGQSSALRQVCNWWKWLAASDATVLLLGETGTARN